MQEAKRPCSSMTNRKKAGRSKSTKKSPASTEKPTRKSHRRTRRRQKSDSSSPEADDSGSDDAILVTKTKGQSEQTDSKTDRGKGDSSLDSVKASNAAAAEDEEQKRGEESASSGDGSWKVKSENSEGGGIPKLKLCLQRPNDSSPVPEQLPSPRRRPRSTRGAVSPVKVDSVEEVPEPRTSTRRSRAAKEVEVAGEQSEPVVEATVEKEEPSPMPEEEQVEVEPVQEKEEPVIEIHQAGDDETLLAVAFIVEDQERHELVQVNNVCVDQSEVVAEETLVVHYQDNSKELVRSEEHTEVVGSEEPAEVVTNQESAEVVASKEPAEVVTNDPLAEVATNKELAEVIQKEEPAEVIQKEESTEVTASEEPIKVVTNEDSVKIVPQVEITEIEELISEPEPAQIADQKPARIAAKNQQETPSRDSSEERAKIEALKSRRRKKEDEEETEIEEVPEKKSEPSLDQTSIKAEPQVVTQQSTPTELSNVKVVEQKAPVVRKRRWGTSTITKTNKKPLVSISTDVLKEIIPEAKPLSLNEVQMSEDEEASVNESKKNNKSDDLFVNRRGKENLLHSDESEKDYEEEVVDESGVDEQENVEPVHDANLEQQKKPEREPELLTRKVSVVSDSKKSLERSPSPAQKPSSNILYITNLVRPFTIPQLKDLLARTGTLVDEGFWIDKIKSKCYVEYETEEQATTTRHALHGVRWPVSNPKQLFVDFGTSEELKAAQDGVEPSTNKSIPSLFERKYESSREESGKDLGRSTSKRDRESERERLSRKLKEERDELRHQRDRDRRRSGSREDSSRDRKTKPQVEPLVRDRPARRVTVPVREWDVGKTEEGFPPLDDDLTRRHDRKTDRKIDDYEDYRRRERDRSRRSASDEPPRKTKKKGEDETPGKLLDDLFRKTKATPCIYWLPLTAEQIAIKEEMRRQHMAEHEKRVAELRKKREQQPKRNVDNRRRRRSKSHSRSRSPRK